LGDSLPRRNGYHEHEARTQRASRLEPTMKLPVITATVIAYAILAAAWICYTELVIR